MYGVVSLTSAFKPPRFKRAVSSVVMTFAVLMLSVPGTVVDAYVPSAGEGRSIQEYRCNLRKSYVRFKAHTNIPLLSEVKAVLKRFKFEGWIDTRNPTASNGKIVLDMASIKSETFLVSDKKIRKALKVRQFPKATLETLAVRGTAQPNVFDVDVALEMMGKRYTGTIQTKAIPFKTYIRLIGFYEMQSNDSSKRGRVDFSIQVEPVGGS